MINYANCNISNVAIHYVGNKSTDDTLHLSKSLLDISDGIVREILMRYFLFPFEKENEVYRFYHANHDLELNEAYHFVTEIFNNPDVFYENSKEFARHLYEVSSHPKIKSGELYVVYFSNLQIEGEELDAVGIFKSETKETYLKVYLKNEDFLVGYEQNAININKLDKGVLIFNAEKENGYKVVVVDKTNGSREAALYWKDYFLQLKIRNDSFNQTSNTLGIYKNFVTQKLDDEFDMSKADKIDLLNRSMKYFKEKDTFDMDEFTGEVIGSPKAIESFKTFKSQYEQEFDSPIADTFEISDNAVKKQSRVYKSVLKLDKNFHIYIHGNKELIEKGFDEGKHMNYYKVYFKEEQ